MLHLLPALLLLQTPVVAPRPMVEVPAPARDGGQTRQPLVGNARLSGTVVDERGHPVRNARVSLNGAVSRQVTSDASGAWAFEKIPEGRYTIGTNKTRYISGQFGMRKPDRAGTTVQVGAEDAKTGLVVTIFYGKEKGASISIVVAGIIALATLEPRVQRWIEAKANGSTARGEAESAASPADDH